MFIEYAKVLIRDKTNPDNAHQAIEILKQGLKENNHPNSEAIMLTLQQMLRQSDEHDKARMFLVDCIQTNGTPRIRMQFVQLLREIGNIQGALAEV